MFSTCQVTNGGRPVVAHGAAGSARPLVGKFVSMIERAVTSPALSKPYVVPPLIWTSSMTAAPSFELPTPADEPTTPSARARFVLTRKTTRILLPTAVGVIPE